MKRDIQGKFALKNSNYRLVRSLRLTGSTWAALGITSECLGLTRADYLEYLVHQNALPSTFYPSNTQEHMESLPSNTRYEDEMKALKVEIQNLTQQNAALMERTTMGFSQPELELLRNRILLDLKLGKQAPGYKAVQKALNRFITELTYPNTSIL